LRIIHTEREVEGQVDHDEPGEAVDQPEEAVIEKERDREGNGRRHARRQDPQSDGTARPKTAARQCIGGWNAERQRQSCGSEADNDVVTE